MPRTAPRIEHPDNQLNLGHKFISLTKGLFARVDAELFDHFNQWWWYASKHSNAFYAERNIRVSKGKQRRMLLHREVWEYLNGPIPAGYSIDHRNLDELDNRIENLRLATASQQQWNQNRTITNTSGYIGVTNVRNSWRAQITLNSRCVHLGSFNNSEDAAKARDLVAWIERGGFAVLNFPGLYGGNQ